MNKLFGVLGLMMMAGSIPAFAQNVGVGYKADGSDVSGDFAEAEGDGASVSADVTVGFKIGKKIAIAIKQPDGSFTNNPLFHPSTGFDHNTMGTSRFFLNNPDFSPQAAPWDNLSTSSLSIHGAIYANTDVSITVSPASEFVNEDDPSSTVKPRYHYLLLNGNVNIGDDNNSTTSLFPATANVNVTDFANNGGVLPFFLSAYLYLDTLDATDRSGNYYASTTFTVTAL